MRLLALFVSVLLVSSVFAQQQHGGGGSGQQHGGTGQQHPDGTGQQHDTGRPEPVAPPVAPREPCAKPVECAEGKLPEMVNGCPSCILRRAAESEDRVIGGKTVPKCADASIPECAEGETPKRVAETGCPTCHLVVKPVEPCTPEKMEALPECSASADAQVMPLQLPGGGCPTCKRAPMPVCTKTDIPDCAASEKSEHDKTTGCLSCKVPNPFAGCTKEQFAACAVDQLPECAEDVKPTIAACCPTCKHTPPAAIADRDEAAKAEKRQARPDCAKASCPDLASLPVCAADAKPFKVATDADVATDATATLESRCCRPCRPAPPAGPTAPVPKPPANDRAKCTKEEMDKCLAAVPECAEGEHPTPVKESCCHSCKRVERKCTAEQVAACAADTPVCADGVKPERVESAPCCHTCRPPAPVCDPVCADGEVCVPTHKKPAAPKTTATDASAPTVAVTAPTGMCVAAKTQEIEVTVTTTTLLEVVADPAAAAELVKEAVNRLCDRADQAERCTPGAMNVVHNCSVAVGLDEKKNGRVRIDCPNPEQMEDIPAEDQKKDHIRTIIDALHDNSTIGRTDIHVNPNRTKCEIDHASLPVCAEGQPPQHNFTTMCPSCRPPNPFEGCTEEQKQACTKHADLPECAADAKPKIEACCETCKPAKPVGPAECGKVCDMSAVAECAADAKPEFNKDTCCPSCKMPRPPVEKPIEHCTPEEMASCLETVAVCATAEKPQKLENACCMSCKRAERLCTKEQVANCSAQAPECAADQKPEHPEGSCCPTCHPPKPVCSPACAEGQICVGPPTATKCEEKKQVRLNITAPPHVCKRVMDIAKDPKQGPKEMEQLVKEMVERSCDKAANETKCKPVPERIDAIDVKKMVPKGPCAVNVDVDVSGDMVHVINNTVADVEANDYVITASVIGGSSSATEQDSAASGSSVAVIAAIVAAVAVAVVVAVVVVRRRRVPTQTPYAQQA